MTSITTLKSITYTAIFSALLASGPAVASDHGRTLTYGGFSQHNGITVPADLREQASDLGSAAAPGQSKGRVYGAFVDNGGIAVPLSGQSTPVVATAARSPIATARNELRFGSYIQINGIALPASPAQRLDNRATAPAAAISKR